MSKEMGLFAATPPLEALKYLLSIAATAESGSSPRAANARGERDGSGLRAAKPSEKQGSRGNNDKVMMVNDVARAFFEAPIQRQVCVEIPQEDKEKYEEDCVGLLVKSLYGTRDAAMNFQKEV